MGQIFITPSEEARLEERMGRERRSSFAKRAIRFEPSSPTPTPSQSPDPGSPSVFLRDVRRAKSKTEDVPTVQGQRTESQSRRSFRESLSTLRLPSPLGSVPRLEEKRTESLAPIVVRSPSAPRDAAPERERVGRAVLPNASPSAPQRRERGLGHRHNAQSNLRAGVDENIRKPSLLGPLVTCCMVVAVGAAIMSYSVYYLSQQQYGAEGINSQALDARRDNDTIPRAPNGSISGEGGISSQAPAETDPNAADRDFNTLGQDTIALVLGRGN